MSQGTDPTSPGRIPSRGSLPAALGNTQIVQDSECNRGAELAPWSEPCGAAFWWPVAWPSWSAVSSVRGKKIGACWWDLELNDVGHLRGTKVSSWSRLQVRFRGRFGFRPTLSGTNYSQRTQIPERKRSNGTSFDKDVPISWDEGFRGRYTMSFHAEIRVFPQHDALPSLAPPNLMVHRTPLSHRGRSAS